MTAQNAGLWLGWGVALVGAFGLVIGSFLNVVVYRVPNGMSIVAPPSACPNCGSGIKGYDNIPVLSWVLLGGKCRSCAEPISRRYPLVELGTGVFFAGVVVWLWGTGASASSATGLGSGAGVGASAGSATVAGILVVVAFLYLAAVSVALALIDLDTRRLPNAIVLPSYLVGAILLGASAILNGNFSALLSAGVGMAALFLLYLIMALIYPGGMGFGDVKLAGVLGLFLGFLGWGPLVVGAFAAFLLGGIFAIGLMVLRKAGRKSGIPFGPWMLVGAWVGIFFGNVAWGAYLSLLGLG